jgi:hypothetical protein
MTTPTTPTNAERYAKASELINKWSKEDPAFDERVMKQLDSPTTPITASVGEPTPIPERPSVIARFLKFLRELAYAIFMAVALMCAECPIIVAVPVILVMLLFWRTP